MKIQKNLLLGLFLIGVTAAAAISSTAAYFTAKKTAASNKFVIGTLDLDIASANGKLEPISIDGLGGNADVAGQKTWTVKNTGSLPGRLLIKLANVKNLENGCNQPEKETEPNCETDNVGELGKIITVKILVDNQEKAVATLADQQSEVIANQWYNLPAMILNPGESKTLIVSWQANETDYGNEVQSDSVEFDLDFRLVQTSKTP